MNSNVQWSNLNGKPTLCLQHDHYFVGRVPDEERPLGAVAAMHASDGIVAHRWWTLCRARRDRRGRLPAGTRGPGPAAARTLVSGQPVARQLVDELLRVDRADAGDQVVALARGVALDRDRLAPCLVAWPWSKETVLLPEVTSTMPGACRAASR